MIEETNINNQNQSDESRTTSSIKTIFIVLIAGFLLLFAGLAVWYFLGQTDKGKPGTNKSEAEKKAAIVASQECGELIPDGGTLTSPAPFTPTLRAKITGLYDRTRAVCGWEVDGETLPNTFSYKGYCIFKGRTFTTPGKHTIEYKVDYLSGCPKTTTITVK
ncbi:MAG: hypothetical protein WCI63_04570 [bacterium]